MAAGVLGVLACAFPETPAAKNARSALQEKIAFERDAQIMTMDGKVITAKNLNAYAIAPDTRTFVKLAEGRDDALLVTLSGPSRPDALVLELPAPPANASADVSSSATRLTIEWTSSSGSRFLALDHATKDLYYITGCNSGYQARHVARAVDAVASNAEHIYLLKGSDIRRISFLELGKEQPVVTLPRPAEVSHLA